MGDFIMRLIKYKTKKGKKKRLNPFSFTVRFLNFVNDAHNVTKLL